MTARNLGEADAVVLDQVIVDTRRAGRGRYWTRIRSGLIVVSDDELTVDRPRAVIIPCNSHTFAATAGAGLDHHWIANFH